MLKKNARKLLYSFRNLLSSFKENNSLFFWILLITLFSSYLSQILFNNFPLEGLFTKQKSDVVVKRIFQEYNDITLRGFTSLATNLEKLTITVNLNIPREQVLFRKFPETNCSIVTKSSYNILINEKSQNYTFSCDQINSNQILEITFLRDNRDKSVPIIVYTKGYTKSGKIVNKSTVIK